MPTKIRNNIFRIKKLFKSNNGRESCRGDQHPCLAVKTYVTWLIVYN